MFDGFVMLAFGMAHTILASGSTGSRLTAPSNVGVWCKREYAMAAPYFSEYVRIVGIF